MVIKFNPAAGETISGMDTGISMECAKICHTVGFVGIPFYNVVREIEGGSRRRRCRFIPKREMFSK
jgi:hypothetical protein